MKQYKLEIKKKRLSFIKELEEYILIPSISTDKKYSKDLNVASSWLVQRMKRAGLENVKMLQTRGNPLVFGEWNKKEDCLTVLFYGHYDVQPPDPIEKWRSDPFKLSIRKGNIYGRGVADNKTPHLAHIQAVELLLDKEKDLPVNVKFLIEGEEEIGSVNIGDALKEHKNLLKSDIAIVTDGEMDFDGPVIDYGLRGIIAFEILVKCLRQDAHSGIYGGVVDNPAFILSKLLSRMKDKRGRITIPDIYKDVRNISKKERSFLRKSDTKSSEIRENTGAKRIFGEKGYLNIERTGARPSLDINGMISGYTGEGMKTIIPAEAKAKLTMRLVPNQESKRIMNCIKRFVVKNTPSTCNVDVIPKGGSEPILFDWGSREFEFAAKSLEKTFSSKVKYKLCGGSIGAVESMKKELGIDSIVTGFSLPDCGMHSPNENFKVTNYLKAIEFTVQYLKCLIDY